VLWRLLSKIHDELHRRKFEEQANLLHVLEEVAGQTGVIREVDRGEYEQFLTSESSDEREWRVEHEKEREIGVK
jgi:hypothetical protein